MATNGKHNLMGYDPLAWMGEEPDLDALTAIEEEENFSATPVWQGPDPIKAAANTAELDEQVGEWDEAPDLESESLASEAQPLSAAAASDTVAASSITLEPNLTMQHLAALHESLKASLLAYEHLEIDAGGVIAIDTATLQLLVSLKKAAQRAEKQVSIKAASPRFIESAKLLGLGEFLEVATDE